MSTVRNLPPLEVGATYVAADFQAFEYSAALLTGSEARMILHLKNGTTIGLPTSETELARLSSVLMHAFPKQAFAFAKERGWVS